MRLFILLTIVCLALAFDKNLMRKGKRDPTDKHPISRRVLRYERSVMPDEVHIADMETHTRYGELDFSKTFPEELIKTKTSDRRYGAAQEDDQF